MSSCSLHPLKVFLAKPELCIVHRVQVAVYASGKSMCAVQVYASTLNSGSDITTYILAMENTRLANVLKPFMAVITSHLKWCRSGD